MFSCEFSEILRTPFFQNTFEQLLLNFTNENKASENEISNRWFYYYIGYITIKKFSDYENIHSVNPLYLIIYSAIGYFNEKNGEKYLILDSTDKYEEVFSEIRSEIKTLNGGK